LLAHWAEVVDDVRFGVRRRLDTLVDVAGLDEERARAWVVVRTALAAATPRPDRDWLTRCVAVIKAMEG
jgi:streptomycin 6-kinase